MNDYVKIPKIMHFVWLGKQQIPENLTKCMKTCCEHHPEWKKMVWTDKNMPAPFFFTDEYNIDRNPARRSDLIRLQVLYNYGGVYLDTDIECIKPIDKLMEGHNFVMGTECGEPWKKDCNRTHINNAVIASTKRSILVEKLINQVKENYKKIDISSQDKPLDYVAHLSGPVLFNNMINEIKNNKGTKIYSAEYFYPLHYSNRMDIRKWQIPSNKTELDEKTHLIHHFASSWYSIK